jgi:hypothetical protein
MRTKTKESSLCRPIVKVNSSWVISDGGDGCLASVGHWLLDQHKHRDANCNLTLRATHAMPLEGSPGFGNGSVRDGSNTSSPLVSSALPVPFKAVQSVKVKELSFMQGLFLSTNEYWLATILSMNIPYKLWFEKQTSTLELVFAKVYSGVRLADGTGPG